MEATSVNLLRLPLRLPIRKINSNPFHAKRRSSARLLIVSASARDHQGHHRGYFEGNSSVDEAMVVFRRRIHEIEAVESKEVSSGWMQWEEYYRGGRYGSDVCDVVANLQIFLMSTTSSFALGIVALLFVMMATIGMVFV